MATIDRRGATVSATDAPASSTPNPDLAIKTAVRVVATAPINIQTFGLGTIDGIALAAGDRVLLTAQTDATQNGIYNAGTGVWAYSSDFQNNSQIACGLQVHVNFGTVYGNTLWWVSTPDPIVLGTTAITFSQSIGFTGTVKIAPPANTLVQGLEIIQSLHGTWPAGNAGKANFITITSDDSATDVSSDPVAALYILHQFGGTNAKGSRSTVFIKTVLTAETNAADFDTDMVGLTSWVTSSVTNTGIARNMFAMNPSATLTGSGSAAGLLGAEVDIGLQGASSANYVIGWNVNNTGTNQAGTQSVGYYVSAIGTSPGWQYALAAGNRNGGNALATTATFAALLNAQTIGNGLDLSLATITGNFLAGPGSSFLVTGAGAVSATGGISSLGLNKGFAASDGTVSGFLVPSTLHTHSAAFGTSTNHPLVLLTNNVEIGSIAAQSGTTADWTFGVAGSLRGTLSLAGNTSGALKVQAPATASGTLTLPAGTTDFSSTGGAGQYVKQASAGGAFTVGTIPASDIASGQALTSANDTNVTLTLGGTPASALLAAASITAGWTGTLSGTRGGTGVNNGASTITVAGNFVVATNGGTLAFGAASKTLTVNNSGTLAGGDGFTLSIAANKTLAASNSLTLAGTDGKTLTLTNSLTITTNDGTLAFGAASKTLTVNNSLTLAGTDGKTVTYNASTTFAGTDGKTLTVSNSGTLGGGDGFTLAIAASKTLTVNNSLTFAGTDATTMTFPTTSQTVAGLGVAQTFTQAQTITPTQAANTSVDGLVLADTTAASAGNQQFSPRIRLTGQGWKTTATAASEQVDWIIENQPIQDTTTPTTQLNFKSQLNGGGYNNIMQIINYAAGNGQVVFASVSGNMEFDIFNGATQVSVFLGGAGQTIVGSINNAPLQLYMHNAAMLTLATAGTVQFNNASSFSANGAVATSLGSVGPTGSHTTVQTWLTIVDSGGTTRYIPCF